MRSVIVAGSVQRLAVAALLIALLTSCGYRAPLPAPPELPPGLYERPERLPWGDRISARMGHLAGSIHRQLYDSYGAVHETLYIARVPTSVTVLERWYRARLGATWTLLPLSLLPEGHGFAFIAGRQAFAVGWIDPLPGGRIPVVTMRYGDPDRTH